MNATIVVTTTITIRTVSKVDSTDLQCGAMPWRRLRRRTMAPSRPAVYPDQIGLVVLTAVMIALGVYVAVRIFTG